MRLPSLLADLDGPPPSLPRLLDAASERWWGLPPRLRLLLALLAALLLLGAVVLRPVAVDAPVRVAVATRELPAGHELQPGDLREERRPAAHAPETARRLGGSGARVAGTLTSALPRGSVLTERHLGSGGLGALVDEGRAAVALPRELVPDPRVGTGLGLVVTDEIGPSRPPVPARILRVDADHVWVDVAQARAGGVAAAAARHAVAVVVRPS